MHVAHELKVIWMAMVPVIELRGAIPYGILREINPWMVFLLAWFGSTIIIAPVYYFFIPCMNWLESIPKIGPVFKRFRDKVIRKGHKLGKVEFIGLMVFVGVPLPGTGAWTGAMIASVLKIPFLRSFIAITLGNVMAGVIMMIIYYISHGTVKLFSSP
jgi:uncharacterized membrane protein